MVQERENYDDVVWELNDEVVDEAKCQLTSKSFRDSIVSLVSTHAGEPAKLKSMQLGGYNMIYRVHINGSPGDVIFRMPCQGLCQFREEKTDQEAATIMLLIQQTQLPIPPLLWRGNPPETGPFLMIPYVEHKEDLSDVLSRRREDTSEVLMLDDSIDKKLLVGLYTQLAMVLLQLLQPEFALIGSLRERDGEILVLGRPLTQNMSNMVQLANIPRGVLPSPDETYKSANDWYLALADMHFAQLVFQRNDLVTSEDDCRNKYVARYLFRKLAHQQKLSQFGFTEDKWSAQSNKVKSDCSAPASTGPFRLWCDDLRPSSFLVDIDKNIVAAIDWEFTYAAPPSFVLDPPWWLLLETPEMWPSGLQDWSASYEDKLKVWLSAMEAAEDSSNHSDGLPFTVSAYMRDSWMTGRFWLNYAARKSWAFDAIYWTFLDVKFFGERSQAESEPSWKARVEMLSLRERETMEKFVIRKMKEMKERNMVDWDAKLARSRLAEITVQDDNGWLYQGFLTIRKWATHVFHKITSLS